MRLYRKSPSVALRCYIKFSRLGLVAALLVILGAMPFLTAAIASADNSATAEATLLRQGWYESTVAQAKLKNSDPNAAKTLQDTVNQLKSKKHPGLVAILDNTTIPAAYSDANAYAAHLLSYANPKVDIVVIVNGDKSQVGLATVKLSQSEQTAIRDARLSTFTANHFGLGVQQVALDAENKIASQETSSLITTIVIVLVVLAVVAGAIIFFYISTKNNWQRQLESLRALNSKVTDLVVKIGDGVDYLPDQTRDQAKSSFGQATANMSNAQAGVRELEKATPFQLMFGGGKYRQELNATEQQLQSSYNLLTQLDRSIEKV